MTSCAKPTLGYPSRTAAVLALRSQGLSTAAIAHAIGIPNTTVSALECSARRAPGTPHAQEAGRPVIVPIGLLQRLAPAARKRNLSRETLAWMILDTVVEAGLVDAVLDDQGDEK